MNNVFCLLTTESGSSMLESIPLWILRDASIFGMDEPTDRGNQNSSFDTLWMSDEDKKNIELYAPSRQHQMNVFC